MSIEDFQKTVLTVTFMLFAGLDALAQLEGTFIDQRDGKTYQTVAYSVKKNGTHKEVMWMAENLNFSTPNSFCVNADTSNCAKYGRLYTWFEAKQACPEGWRLPSDDDWSDLASLYDGMEKAGKHLKAKGQSNGTNKSLFNGLLAGARDPATDMYFKANTAGFFWSSTESEANPEEAYDWSFASWSDELRHWEGGKLIGNSCRCVKNLN